jgi:uncharacterized protein (DUF2384 family)
MTEDYFIHVELMPAGEKSDVIVMDRKSGVQIGARVAERMAPNLIAALISSHRERHNTIFSWEEYDLQRSRRSAAAKQAATKVFANEKKAEGWLLTPRSSTGFRSAYAVAASTDEGLNFVLALLHDPSLNIYVEPPDQLERVLLARRPENGPWFGVDEVKVVKSLRLGDSKAGHTAWLLALPDNRFEVVVEGIEFPQSAGDALTLRIEEHLHGIANIKAFIAEACRLGALSAST